MKNENISSQALAKRLEQIPALRCHPQAEHLIGIVTGETNISTAGFPFISDRSFRVFIENVPHLFGDGEAILAWLDSLASETADLSDIPYGQLESMQRASKVLRTIVHTAGITAVPDLWLLRQVLSAHCEIGVLPRLTAGHALDPEEFAVEHGCSLSQLQYDLRFLYSRGYLRKGDGNYIISNTPAVAATLAQIQILPPDYRINFVEVLVEWFTAKNPPADAGRLLRAWSTFDVPSTPSGSWIADYSQIELGYRLLPLILSLRVLQITANLKKDSLPGELIPNLLPEMQALFSRAGYTHNGRVSDLGARIFQRGPGPFGIIGAYHPYLNNLVPLLKSEKAPAWVNRAANVGASQDANRKTFTVANDQLDRFCEKYGYEYAVFVEHAVGQGEATRQRFSRDAQGKIDFFGADLEDDAIDQAIKQQSNGTLPPNMQFIRGADIGDPQRVIKFLAERGHDDQRVVMMVGNGFHEIRQQTNAKMIEVFRAYQEAGFLLIFTEESALHDEALIYTAWNTYHAGFRYVHDISGQGLRPAVERPGDSERWSWKKCATLGGYLVLDEFSYRSRTIYPYKRPQHKNPSISVTYFCVPYQLAIELGIDME